MAANAATLFTLTGDEAYRTHAETLITRLAGAGRDAVGSASLQAAFDTMLRGRAAFVIDAGQGEGDALFAAALAEADPALFLSRADPAALPPGHPAYGKRPGAGPAALFLCDAFRCLPEITDANVASDMLSATRRGLA
jgi:uncharacterized protein YyaL (SSP411 family)